MRASVDKGGGSQNRPIFCGRPLCTTPKGPYKNLVFLHNPLVPEFAISANFSFPVLGTLGTNGLCMAMGKLTRFSQKSDEIPSRRVKIQRESR